MGIVLNTKLHMHAKFQLWAICSFWAIMWIKPAMASSPTQAISQPHTQLHHYSTPVEVWSIVINHLSVHVSVCLSVRLSVCPRAYHWNRFVRRCPVAMAQSSCCSVALCYVLPVLWMTLRLAIGAVWACMDLASQSIAHLMALRDRGRIWCLWMACLLC